MDFDVNESAGIETKRRYAGVGCHSSVVVLSGRLDLDVASERARHEGDRVWDKVDVMDSVRQMEYS